jgi:HEAT repeat protein
VSQRDDSAAEAVNPYRESPRRKGSILSLLLENLHNPNPRVRMLAVREIADNANGRTLASVLELAEGDPALEVRCAAILALGDLTYLSGVTSLEEEDGFEEWCEEDALEPADLERVRDFLLSVYYDRGRTLEERRRAVESLSHMADGVIEDVIAELYACPEKDAKISALKAMGSNGARRWEKTLQHALLHPDREILIEAIHAAGESGMEGLGTELWSLTYAEDKDVALAAIWALGQTGWEGAFERLDELTLDADPRIRECADEAMEEWLFFNGLLEGGSYSPTSPFLEEE